MSNFNKSNHVATDRSKKRKLAKCKSLGISCENCHLACFYKAEILGIAEEKPVDQSAELAKAEEEARLKAEAEAKAKAEEEARLKAEAEAKAKAEEEARLKAEAEAKAKAEEEARLKAEAEAKAKAEEEAKVEEPAPVAAPEEESAEEATEEPAPVEEKGFKLTNAKDAAEILPRIATKRARKLIYVPKDVIFETTCTIDVENKKNDEGIKVKNILEAEIKEGLKLGYLDKYDGLKMSEIKEEYENDTIYEVAEQEFKKMGLLLDGDKVKVYVFDWTGNGLHHIGYLTTECAEQVIPYLIDMDKYSFDLCGLITGGKCKTITKDPKSGKITVSKGKDGNYGVDLDITILNRKD